MSFFRPLTPIGLALGCVAALVGGPSALADTPLTYTDRGQALFRIDVPDFWTARVGGDRRLTAPGDSDEREIPRVIGLTPEDGSGVFVGFMAPRRLASLEDGLAYIEELGPQVAGKVSQVHQDRRVIAGRQAVRITGTGRRNSRNVEFTAVLIDLPGDRIAFSMTVLEAGYDPAVLADVNRIYDSFRAR